MNLDGTGETQSIELLEALLADPGRWPYVDPELLRHLVFYQCLSYGIHSNDALVSRLMGIYRVGVDRLHPGVRQQIAVQVARAVERLHRQHGMRSGAGCTNGLLPFLIEDPDPSVVATAAFEMAILLPLEDQDPLSGPRYVRTLFDQVALDDARAGLVAGLLQLGDERVWPFVDGTWATLQGGGPQTLALLIQAFKGLSALTAEFLVAWLEHAASDTQSALFGTVAATLARAGGHATDHGVADVRRTLPVIDSPETEPFSVTRTWSLDDFVPRVAERLVRVASIEQPPQLMPHVLAYWGMSDYAYRICLAAACVSAASFGESTRTCVESESGPEPEEGAASSAGAVLEVAPPWGDRDDMLVEWTVFDGSVPTIHNWRATMVPPVSRMALVYTRYHPTRSVARLVAALPGDASVAVVEAALVDAIGRCTASADAGSVLPEYLDFASEPPIDREVVLARLADVIGIGIGGTRESCVAHLRRCSTRANVDEVRSRVPTLWEASRSAAGVEPRALDGHR